MDSRANTQERLWFQDLTALAGDTFEQAVPVDLLEQDDNEERTAASSPAEPDNSDHDVRPPTPVVRPNVPAAAERFRLRATNIFLTYAKTSWAVLRDHLPRLLNSLGAKRWIIGLEHHKDGGEHGHAYAQWDPNVPHQWSERDFDLTNEGAVYHPAIEGTRNPAHAIRYTAKDKNTLLSGEFPELLEPSSKKKKTKGEPVTMTIGRALLGGKPVQELAQEYPQILMTKQLSVLITNQALVRGWTKENADRILTKIHLKPFFWEFKPTAPSRGPGGNHMVWLYGPAGTGKSKTVEDLQANGWRLYFYNKSNDKPNWGYFEQSLFDAIVFEEVSAETLKEISQSSFNRICAPSGQAINLNTKGGSCTLTKKMPVIFISNDKPEDILKAAGYNLEPAMSRIIVYRAGKCADPRHTDNGDCMGCYGRTSRFWFTPEMNEYWLHTDKDRGDIWNHYTELKLEPGVDNQPMP